MISGIRFRDIKSWILDIKKYVLMIKLLAIRSRQLATTRGSNSAKWEPCFTLFYRANNHYFADIILRSSSTQGRIQHNHVEFTHTPNTVVLSLHLPIGGVRHNFPDPSWIDQFTVSTLLQWPRISTDLKNMKRSHFVHFEIITPTSMEVLHK